MHRNEYNVYNEKKFTLGVGVSSFLQQSKDKHIRLLGNLAVGECECECEWLSVLALK